MGDWGWETFPEWLVRMGAAHCPGCSSHCLHVPSLPFLTVRQDYAETLETACDFAGTTFAEWHCVVSARESPCLSLPRSAAALSPAECAFAGLVAHGAIRTYVMGDLT